MPLPEQQVNAGRRMIRWQHGNPTPTQSTWQQVSLFLQLTLPPDSSPTTLPTGRGLFLCRLKQAGPLPAETDGQVRYRTRTSLLLINQLSQPVVYPDQMSQLFTLLQ
jgi:hypothetical protein